MRLDLFLKKTRIIKRRSLAKEFIERGVVTIEGERSKPSKNVHKGMKIKLGDITYEIISIPEREIVNNEGDKYYKVMNDRDYSG